MLITSKDNLKIKELKELISSKKMRINSRSFVIEGIRIFAEAVRENADIKSVFVTETALNKYADVFKSLRPDNFYVIADELSKKVTDEKSPQGIFAVVNNLDKELTMGINFERVLVLNNIQDPGNIGTLLRTADALGVKKVILCENCCELYNPKVIRSTMGSIFRLDISVVKCFETVVKYLKANNITTYAAVVDKQAQSIENITFDGKCAAVIGNEGNGLSDEHTALCDSKITISMKGNAESLNASVAAAIILWEMTK